MTKNKDVHPQITRITQISFLNEVPTTVFENDSSYSKQFGDGFFLTTIK